MIKKNSASNRGKTIYILERCVIATSFDGVLKNFSIRWIKLRPFVDKSVFFPTLVNRVLNRIYLEVNHAISESRYSTNDIIEFSTQGSNIFFFLIVKIIYWNIILQKLDKLKCPIDCNTIFYFKKKNQYINVCIYYLLSTPTVTSVN